ncbi:MAG: GDP-mannose pyrophosphatase NudK [Anaerolineae bacterium]|nr:GDP-mannose pyrophosphatase NudK [Anaerolineae bacterium]
MNERIRIQNIETLSDNWYVLRKVIFEYQQKNGVWQTQSREAYDRGNGATILLYNQPQRTVILTRQFRVPTYVNGNPDGMLIEACAGLLDEDHPEEAIRRETEEETGYRVQNIRRIFEAYMSPGSVTEKLYFFVAEYTPESKINAGGGLDSDGEDIEVLELPFETALHMIKTGEICDGKTIMLLQYAQIHGLFNA